MYLKIHVPVVNLSTLWVLLNSMNLYLGLDISISGTGLVAVDDEYKVVHSIKLSSQEQLRDVERLYFLKQLMQHHLDIIKSQGDVIQCALEIPAYQAEGRLVEIGEITGIEKVELYLAGIPFIRVAPLQLKKYVSGKGVGGKSLILLDVFKNFKEEFRDDNEADAYVLARIARDFKHYYIDKEDMCTHIKGYQQEVLKKLYDTYSKSTKSLL